ncbi:MAG: hypothetical protein PHU23_00190 [Dehalococcoidales bacterium]|nr:hypothetical protein [Dehalococcoidales bacterium]
MADSVSKANYELLTRRPTIVPGNTTANWNSGVATSGNPGADLVTIGTPGQWCDVSNAVLRLADFNVAATVTVRAYTNMMGVEVEIMNEDYSVAADGEVVFMIWWWEVEQYGAVRVEVFSDQVADDGVTVSHEYRIKT